MDILIGLVDLLKTGCVVVHSTVGLVGGNILVVIKKGIKIRI